MSDGLRWADGGCFRIVEGRRVWVDEVPASVRDELVRDAEEREAAK